MSQAETEAEAKANANANAESFRVQLSTIYLNLQTMPIMATIELASHPNNGIKAKRETTTT